MGLFKRFVQTGRIVYLPEQSKVCAVVDIIDQNRVLVDGPETGVPRQPMHLNKVQLTKLRIVFPRSARTRVIRKAWNEADISKKWSESSWAKNLHRRDLRKEVNDFDRHRLFRARRKRNYLRKLAFKKLVDEKRKKKHFRQTTKAEYLKLHAKRTARKEAAAKSK